MPRSSTPDDLSLLYSLLSKLGAPDERSDEVRFRETVDRASKCLEIMLASTTTEAEMLARFYMEQCGGRKNVSKIVEDLINISAQKSTKAEPHEQQLDYDTLLRMASIILRSPREMDENLRFFIADVIDDTFLDKDKKKRPRPTLRGPNKDTNFHRNQILRTVHHMMVTYGFNKFRSESKKNEGDFACSYKGGSGIDVLGVAYYEVTGKRLSYKTIEGIVTS